MKFGSSFFGTKLELTRLFIEYTMVDQTVIVEGRLIEHVQWDDDKHCFRLTEWDIPTFLGHQEKEYEVDNLFSKITKPWFTAMFEGLTADPK